MCNYYKETIKNIYNVQVFYVKIELNKWKNHVKKNCYFHINDMTSAKKY